MRPKPKQLSSNVHKESNLICCWRLISRQTSNKPWGIGPCINDIHAQLVPTRSTLESSESCTSFLAVFMYPRLLRYLVCRWWLVFTRFRCVTRNVKGCVLVAIHPRERIHSLVTRNLHLMLEQAVSLYNIVKNTRNNTPSTAARLAMTVFISPQPNYSSWPTLRSNVVYGTACVTDLLSGYSIAYRRKRKTLEANAYRGQQNQQQAKWPVSRCRCHCDFG